MLKQVCTLFLNTALFIPVTALSLLPAKQKNRQLINTVITIIQII